MTAQINNSPYLSIIIPVYNDVDALRAFLPSVIDFCYELGQPSEVIVVDDGSQDEIPNLMQTFIKACQQASIDQADWNVDLQLLKLSRNFGKESALSAGLAHANGELVTMMDCDGKHPLDVLSKMIKMMRAQPHIDMIAAIRTSQQQTNMIQNIKASFYNVVLDSARYEIKPNSDNFRLMNRKVVQALNVLPERQRFMKGLYSWVGFHTVYLPYDRKKPQSDLINIKRKFRDRFKSNQTSTVTSFSRKPLHWITRFGFLFFILAIFYTLYIIIDKLFLANGGNGSSLIILSILLLAGIQFFSLGILGEYIGRLYDEVKERPIYLIDKHLSSETSSEEELKIPTFANTKKTSKSRAQQTQSRNTSQQAGAEAPHRAKNRTNSKAKSASSTQFNKQSKNGGPAPHPLSDSPQTNTAKKTKSISQVRSENVSLATISGAGTMSEQINNEEDFEHEQISLKQLEELVDEGSIQLALPELND